MKRSVCIHKGSGLEPVVFIVSTYVKYVLISFVTLPHLMRSGFILFCPCDISPKLSIRY